MTFTRIAHFFLIRVCMVDSMDQYTNTPCMQVSGLRQSKLCTLLQLLDAMYTLMCSHHSVIIDDCGEVHNHQNSRNMIDKKKTRGISVSSKFKKRGRRSRANASMWFSCLITISITNCRSIFSLDTETVDFIIIIIVILFEDCIQREVKHTVMATHGFNKQRSTPSSIKKLIIHACSLRH